MGEFCKGSLDRVGVGVWGDCGEVKYCIWEERRRGEGVGGFDGSDGRKKGGEGSGGGVWVGFEIEVVGHCVGLEEVDILQLAD